MTKQQSQMADSSLPAELAAPVRRALNGAGIQRLEQLAQQNAADISQLHGIGPNALSQLRSALHKKGLSFADEKSSD